MQIFAERFVSFYHPCSQQNQRKNSWFCDSQFLRENSSFSINVSRNVFSNYCCKLTLDWTINQRCTCVNKCKRNMWSTGRCRHYEIIYADTCLWVGVSEGLSQSQLVVKKSISLGSGSCNPQQALRLSTPSQEAEEVLNGILKITLCTVVKRRYGSI